MIKTKVTQPIAIATIATIIAIASFPNLIFSALPTAKIVAQEVEPIKKSPDQVIRSNAIALLEMTIISALIKENKMQVKTTFLSLASSLFLISTEILSAVCGRSFPKTLQSQRGSVRCSTQFSRLRWM